MRLSSVRAKQHTHVHEGVMAIKIRPNLSDPSTWNRSDLIGTARYFQPRVTASLSGFYALACFCRMAVATWADDAPLETVANRSVPMECGSNVDQGCMLGRAPWEVLRALSGT
jgi:hypothetical protein